MRGSRLPKAMLATEFFMVQMDYHRQVCDGTSVWHNSIAMLYIQMLSVQMYSKWLKPLKLDGEGPHDMRELGVCHRGIVSFQLVNHWF